MKNCLATQILKIVFLIIMVWLIPYSVAFGQVIQVASIHSDRINKDASDNGYTLNGSKMIDTALPKLSNLANFGPSGTIKQTLQITHTFNAIGSITASSLAPFDILFIGLTSINGSITADEQKAIRDWTRKPGKVVILAEQPSNSPVTQSYGYDLAEQPRQRIRGSNPTKVAPSDSLTHLFSGPFGDASAINQEGSSQGYFSTDCFSVVIARNAYDQASIIYNAATRDILLADTDFFTTVPNPNSINPKLYRVSEGPNIDRSRDYDKVWGNIWAWAVDEVLDQKETTNAVFATVIPACDGDTGSINFTSPMGTSSNGQLYQYSIDGSNFQDSPHFRNVEPGIYKIYSRTSTSCPITGGDSVRVLSNETAPIITTILHGTCGATTGSIQLNGLPSSGMYALYRIPGGLLTSQGNGLTFIDKQLSPGYYSYYYHQVGNCQSLPSAEVKVTIIEPPRILKINSTPSSCNEGDGTTEIDIQGGIKPLKFALNGITFQSSNKFNDLSPGTYEITVIDSLECIVKASIEIKAKLSPRIDSIRTIGADCIEKNGSILVYATGEVPLSYQLDSMTAQNSNLFDHLASNTYSLHIIDQAGCLATSQINVDNNCSGEIFLPSAFSPEGNGKNETWIVHLQAKSLTVKKLQIYNRWGELIYRNENFEINDRSSLWDGRVNGRVINAGIFPYSLEWFSNGKPRFVQGNVHVFR